MTTSRLSLRLVVQDAPAAIDFYRRALGATELVRYAEPNGTVVHAELQLGGAGAGAGATFALTEDDGDANCSPASLGGATVQLSLVVPDADAVGAAMVAAGAEVVFPIEDQYYGMREGRLRDPFGHLWIITQQAADPPAEEIQRRLTEGAPSS